MNEEPIPPLIVPVSPIPDTSFSNLFEDVDQVKTHLDCLGLPYNPNRIANLLLEYDCNENRVDLVVNRLIDEPPDIEITFERNSPPKVPKSSPQKTTTNVDLTGETSAVKSRAEITAFSIDLTGEKSETKQPLKVDESSEDAPSPSKRFKSSILEGNPFFNSLPKRDNLFKSENATEVSLASSSNVSSDVVINIGDIEEFLNNKEPVTSLENFNDDSCPLRQNQIKLAERLRKLKENSQKQEKDITQKVLKTAANSAEQDLKSGEISSMPPNDDKNQEHSGLAPITTQVTGSIPHHKNFSDDTIESEDGKFSRVKEITSQLDTVDRDLNAPSSPSSSGPSISSNDSSSSVSKLIGFSSNFDKLGQITARFQKMQEQAGIGTFGSSFCNRQKALEEDPDESKKLDRFLDAIIDNKTAKITPTQITNGELSQMKASTSASSSKTEQFDWPTISSQELSVIDELVDELVDDVLAPRKTIATPNALKQATVLIQNDNEPSPVASSLAPKHETILIQEDDVPRPVASSSRIEVIPCEPSTSGTSGSSCQSKRTNGKTHASSSRRASEPMPKYLPNLMEIFPDANPGYLRDLCKSTDNKKKFPNENEVLQQLIDAVMDNPNYPRRAAPVLENKLETALSFDEKYQNIIAIIPNIDPEFVENKCKEILDDERYSAFVNELLSKKDYPTLKDYERRKETEKAIQAYTDNFTIAGFLEVFPDPEDYFINKKSSNHHELSLAFLKDRYKMLRATDITKAYKTEDSNLTRTCLKLDNYSGPKRATRRGVHECRWPPKKDVNFLQEISYINNKDQIKEYIEKKKKDREEAFRRAKENNELFTCGCCFEDEVMKDDVVTCPEGHVFCQQCLRRMGEMKLGERKSKVECMDQECVAEFTLKDLQKVLAPGAFSKFVKIKQTEEIKAAGIEGLVACPFCEFSSIPPPEDKIFKCLNPDCMKESCRLCDQESHIPLRCDEVERNEDVKARLMIEEKMTEALARECYKCKAKFIKEDGCNKMTCGSCGAMSCYICRAPVKDYTHFNGDGGDNFNLCPLWSDNDLLHVDAVRLTAEAVKNKLLKENPNLKFNVDPTLVLPENAYKKKAKVPHREHQRGLVLNRVIPVDVPRDNLPPVDLKPPEPVIPPHLLLPHNHAHLAAGLQAHRPHAQHRNNVARRGHHHHHHHHHHNGAAAVAAVGRVADAVAAYQAQIQNAPAPNQAHNYRAQPVNGPAARNNPHQPAPAPARWRP